MRRLLRKELPAPRPWLREAPSPADRERPSRRWGGLQMSILQTRENDTARAELTCERDVELDVVAACVLGVVGRRQPGRRQRGLTGSINLAMRAGPRKMAG